VADLADLGLGYRPAGAQLRNCSTGALDSVRLHHRRNLPLSGEGVPVEIAHDGGGSESGWATALACSTALGFSRPRTQIFMQMNEARCSCNKALVERVAIWSGFVTRGWLQRGQDILVAWTERKCDVRFCGRQPNAPAEMGKHLAVDKLQPPGVHSDPLVRPCPSEQSPCRVREGTRQRWIYVAPALRIYASVARHIHPTVCTSRRAQVWLPPLCANRRLAFSQRPNITRFLARLLEISQRREQTPPTSGLSSHQRLGNDDT
jgi:hypothetical protein